MGERILIVEDDLTLQETLVYNLQKQGYQVLTSSNGNDAIEVIHKDVPDLILLDIMLPGMDGFEVCRKIRKNYTTPILMLTARDDEIDRVVGLEVGADDYLTKPFSMRELIARVKALLRRAHIIEESQRSSGSAKKTYTFENLTINQNRREVKISGEVVDFKPKEFELLLYFAENKGLVLSREQILEKVWGWDYFGDSRTVDVHVRWLREKIEEEPASPKRICTVRSAGYRFDG